jgi:hypothetical protein
MKRLRPDKLHVYYLEGVGDAYPLMPRRYTLTHSDRTGDLYLGIGSDYDTKRISHWYTRLMRDEVLAEWEDWQGESVLKVHCQVSGGLVVGWPGLRDRIFRHELPLALQAFRFGDRALYHVHPELDHAPLWVHFHARQSRYSVQEMWGKPADYSI